MSNITKKENETSFQESLKAYFKGIKLEWSKITWPEKQQVLAQTLVVLGVVIFFTVFVYILDIIFISVLGQNPTAR